MARDVSFTPRVPLPSYSRVSASAATPLDDASLAGLQQPAQNVYEAQVVPAAGAWSGILFPSALFAIVASAIAWLRHKSSQNTSDLESQLILAAYAGSKTALHAAVDTAAAQGTQTYYYIVANAQFMLYEEEHAMEVIREKRRFMSEKGMERDFWMVPNPEFLDSNPEIDNRVRKPCCALVSTDERWITFMKLRYDKVLMGSFTGSTDVKEALKTKGGDPVAAVPEFKLPAQWDATVPYPKYAEDWYKPFLVDAE
jgi:hypothetical protein